ncbi:epoxyqueuosine reductase [Myxococcota bacterium]|nr:epoxyqueuosine reductase [Myxococcota bacterium]
MILAFIKRLLTKQISKEVLQLADLEKSLSEHPGRIEPSSYAPQKKLIQAQYEIARKSLWGIVKYLIGVMPLIRVSIGNIEKGITSLDRNPSTPKTQISPATLAQLEALANRLGADQTGYVKLSPHHVFQEHAVLFDNLIVITQEMDKARVDRAPSYETFKMIHQTYASLGVISTELTEFLRREGFAAQAGSALNGMAVYPILAQQAGLGWVGDNGLLITEDFGPRVRIAVIYTSIDNLPFYQGDEHSWIPDYCQKCRQCIKQCPPGAIHQAPIETTPYTRTYIDSDRCFPEFYDNFGCSVCLKVCPFGKGDYAKLKAQLTSSSSDSLADQ